MKIKVKTTGFYDRAANNKFCLLKEGTVLPVMQMCDINKENYVCHVEKNGWDEPVNEWVIVEKQNAEEL